MNPDHQLHPTTVNIVVLQEAPRYGRAHRQMAV